MDRGTFGGLLCHGRITIGLLAHRLLVGGLIGFLTSQGISEEDASLYAERVRAGAYLVAVTPDTGEQAKAESILANAGAEEPIRRGVG